MSRKGSILIALVVLILSGQAQSSTYYTAKTSATAPLDMTLASTWTTALPTSATAGQFITAAPATTYFLSADWSCGDWAVGYASPTFDLGAGKTWNVVSAANGNGSGIGWYDGGSYVSTVTLKSGTMAFSGTDPILIGYGAERVAGSREHNFIIDGGTVNINGTNAGGTSNAGCITVQRAGMLWLKAGSTMNIASTSRLRVGTDQGNLAYGGLARIDGILNVDGKISVGDYRPNGTLQVGGTINLTATSGNQFAGGSQGAGLEPGARFLLTGGSIIATNHQALACVNSTSDATNPGILMGTGVIDNVDVNFNTGTAGRFKIAPGVDSLTTGTIELRNASLNEGSGQSVAMKLGVTSADKLLISTALKSATIANGITFSALGDLTMAPGSYDLVVAPAITYGGTALSTIGSDVPAVTGDNLVTLLTGLGYTRVTGTAPTAGQFRYYVADAGSSLKSIRVEFAPEPATMALLAFGGMTLLRRRK